MHILTRYADGDFYYKLADLGHVNKVAITVLTPIFWGDVKCEIITLHTVAIF